MPDALRNALAARFREQEIDGALKRLERLAREFHFVPDLERQLELRGSNPEVFEPGMTHHRLAEYADRRRAAQQMGTYDAERKRVEDAEGITARNAALANPRKAIRDRERDARRVKMPAAARNFQYDPDLDARANDEREVAKHPRVADYAAQRDLAREHGTYDAARDKHGELAQRDQAAQEAYLAAHPDARHRYDR